VKTLKNASRPQITAEMAPASSVITPIGEPPLEVASR
jgi:hypothetical protein